MVYLEIGKIFSKQYLVLYCRKMCNKHFENRLTNTKVMSKVVLNREYSIET